jgi:hypothetical protein
MSVQTGVWDTDDRFVPPHVAAHYRVTGKQLAMWRGNGWLGPHGGGTGRPYPWHRDDIAAQIGWLRRINASGRILDDEDAAAGPRLRRLGADIAIRVGRGSWERYAGEPFPTRPYTLAVVSEGKPE